MIDILYIGDLPVYRLSEARYYEDLQRHVDAYICGDEPEKRKEREAFYERNPGHRIMFAAHAQKQYGGPWRYNEVVGYVRLHFLGSQIRGELFMVDKKKIVRSRTKVMRCRCLKVAPELTILRDGSNAEIYETILRYIAAARKELRRRHLDSSIFETTGPYVDWKALLKAHDDRSQSDTR
jgi:hypothetical protein